MMEFDKRPKGKDLIGIRSDGSLPTGNRDTIGITSDGRLPEGNKDLIGIRSDGSMLSEGPGLFGGWKQVEGEPVGTLTTEKPTQDFTTPEFSEFAEAQRARWDLVEYLKVKFNQLHRKK
jgi:hypothetical protein